MPTIYKKIDIDAEVAIDIGVDDILEAFEEMSDEDKAKVIAGISKPPITAKNDSLFRVESLHDEQKVQELQRLFRKPLSQLQAIA